MADGRAPAARTAPMADDTVRDCLAALFPDCVCVAVRSFAATASPNAPTAAGSGGVRALRHSIARRAGRACALAALEEAGVALRDLGTMPDGAPAWPRGIVGAISHSSGLAAAAVSRNRVIRGIGLDVAATRPLEADRAPLFAVPSELRWLSGIRPEERPFWTLVLFAAKESFRKCARPILGFLPDAHRIEIDVSPGPHSVTARVGGAPDTRWAGGFAIQGAYLLVGTTAHPGR